MRVLSGQKLMKRNRRVLKNDQSEFFNITKRISMMRGSSINIDLKGKSFKGATLQNANLSGLDLRGANFSHAYLKGADFSFSKTGIKAYVKTLFFLIAMAISLYSGYILMLTGSSVQSLINSPSHSEQSAGFVNMAFFIIFVRFALWKKAFHAITSVFYIMIVLAITLALFMYLSGQGSGLVAFGGSLALLLITLMIVVGTVLRVVIGSRASDLLFLIAALSGIVFGWNSGGFIATAAMGVTCCIISKRALKIQNRSSILPRIALTISTFFGTHFNYADLTNADFSNAEINNTDFSKARLSGIKWNNTKRQFTQIDNG
jgi:hypothetical protein